MKISTKARHGRHRRNPVGHADHRKRPTYSRVGRLLKQRVALMLAPTISDFEPERPRLGISEQEVQSSIRPAGNVAVRGLENRASAAGTASPTTHQEVPR